MTQASQADGPRAKDKISFKVDSGTVSTEGARAYRQATRWPCGTLYKPGLLISRLFHCG